MAAAAVVGPGPDRRQLGLGPDADQAGAGHGPPVLQPGRGERGAFREVAAELGELAGVGRRPAEGRVGAVEEGGQQCLRRGAVEQGDGRVRPVRRRPAAGQDRGGLPLEAGGLERPGQARPQLGEVLDPRLAPQRREGLDRGRDGRGPVGRLSDRQGAVAVEGFRARPQVDPEGTRLADLAAAGEAAVDLPLEAAQQVEVRGQGTVTSQYWPAARSRSQAACASSCVANAPPATR